MGRAWARRGGAVQRVAAAALMLATACGLQVIGTSALDDPAAPADEAGAAADAAGGADAGQGVDPYEDLLDGSMVFTVAASQERCLAVCDAGTCVDGWCEHDCTALAACSKKIVCPPGVPCRAICSGLGACNGGVDGLAASAVDVRCSGQGSCNGRVVCSGAECAVECSDLGACVSAIQCDAGTCVLRCSGVGSCQGSRTICEGARCAVLCDGPPPSTGDPTCTNSVTCEAGVSCDVRCEAAGACEARHVIANAGVRASVSCRGAGACADGVVASSPDTVVSCQGVGACGGTSKGIRCDNASCRGRCDGTGDPVRFCCTAQRCETEQTGCELSTCP